MTSSAQRRLTRLKRDMVLELFLQRGRFWDAVCDVRFLWGITPATQLPPEEGPGAYPPPGYPADALSQNRAAMYEVDAKLGRWREDLRTVHDRVVPKEGQITANRARSAKQWERFLSACMLFDPPETELVEFADSVRVGVVKLCACCAGTGQVPRNSSFEGDLDSVPAMVGAPIEILPDLDLIHEILQDPRFRGENRRQAVESLPRKPYIVVDEWTTEEDVRKAFTMIAAAQKRDSKGGAPPRDRLTAVECAILCVRHDWKLREVADRLAERFGSASRDTAREYVRLGRKILETF